MGITISHLIRLSAHLFMCYEVFICCVNSPVVGMCPSLVGRAFSSLIVPKIPEHLRTDGILTSDKDPSIFLIAPYADLMRLCVLGAQNGARPQ